MAKMQYNISMRGNGMNTGRQRSVNVSWSMVLCVLLIIALGVTLAVCLPKMSYRQNVREIFVSHMLHECDAAYTTSSKLSRTASSNSSAELASIRSGVYSMDLINQTYSSLEGGGKQLVEEQLFREIYRTIDSCYQLLSTGTTNIIDDVTKLINQLETLRVVVSQL